MSRRWDQLLASNWAPAQAAAGNLNIIKTNPQFAITPAEGGELREIDQLELVKLCRRLVTKTNGTTKAITISAGDRCVLYHCAE
jgi:hypothetical protein